ncbi:MAG: 3-hydroxyacyl-ACP dehydratase FabZ [Kiritimatiellae bacterium]|nr:3-hydroxyacyl-ACP dehydratase FabZ [Kiritimatiellia bacterium]MBQ6923557.1 3-hydroxyacyl-ACP dehydratase FabZ [Kiritimatiellia bacterium]
MPVSYGQKRILELLPHRYPFLLVDKVLEAAEDGTHLVAIKNVTANEPFFQGHFPGNPIMPGVLHVEAIAQACGLMCLSATTEDATRGAEAYDTILASVENAKFRRKIVPGDQMRIETTLLQHSRNMGKARGVITVDGQVATEATLAFLLVPRKS